ncbi:MAG: SGNH/GDSL hydrolase family protein [Chitinophagaceae bacterium]|nr:SGNH/GDSL hydrolase family protein [Rubrivivax sp.]
MQRFIQALAASAVVAALLPGSAHAGTTVTPFSALYVFGDSLSDSGNNALVLGANGAQPIPDNSYVPVQPYGLNAYTNGLVWVNSFAAGIGLPAAAMPSLAGGGDYAYGGARTAVDGVPFPPSANTVLNGFLASPIGVSPSALYVIAVGGNDILEVGTAIAAGAPLSTINTAAAAYASAIGSMVDALQARGAANIVVWDAPNVGKAPAVLAQGALASIVATNIASAFNLALTVELAGEPGVTVFDVFGAVDTIVANPGAFGLTNVTDACGAVPGCDPSQYLFWDGIHPTSAGHALLASGMLAAVAVPEPAGWLMFVFGGLLLGLMRRRQT